MKSSIGFVSSTIEKDDEHYCEICDNSADFSIKVLDRKKQYFCKFCANAISSFLQTGINITNKEDNKNGN